MRLSRNRAMGLAAAAMAGVVLASGTLAMGFARPKRGAANANAGGGNQGQLDISSNPRVAKIQKEAVIELARLAKEYEKGKDTESARECYEQILRVVPNHPEAKKALDNIRDKELTAESKTMIVKATEKWQDTGIDVIANRPLTITADGTWTFKMTRVLEADGMEIPEEMKEFNLGQLVGQIETAGDPKDVKPFAIGKEATIEPTESGRLWLRMYDYDPSDNAGKISVVIQGTFERGRR